MKNYSKLNELEFTKDEELRKKIEELLEKNHGLCPNSIDNDLDNMCPCVRVQETGICSCGLYVRKEQ